MKTFLSLILSGALASLLVVSTACNRKDVAASAKPGKHEHHPPHGGTPVVLGDEVYHIELVADAAAGKLQAFVLDGEMEDFIRSSSPSIEVVASVGGELKTLIFNPVANPATGETVGDTALFEVQADWLKTTAEFDAVIKAVTVRGSVFTDVKFNYPKGNDSDSEKEGSR